MSDAPKLKICMVGTLGRDTWEDLGGASVVILTGPLDAIQAAGRLLYKHVTLVESEGKTT